MTMFLDFYRDIGIMPNSSRTLSKRGFSLALLQIFGERLGEVVTVAAVTKSGAVQGAVTATVLTHH
jgi:hypothetical protein